MYLITMRKTPDDTATIKILVPRGTKRIKRSQTDRAPLSKMVYASATGSCYYLLLYANLLKCGTGVGLMSHLKAHS